jgi:pilus assembly protein FimV
MGMGMPAWSLGFGRPVSRAILGESFSVTVPVRLESAETLDAECLAADVFFGDDKLASSAIKTVLLPGQGAERTVRVSTTALINEPVVTLYVVAGCKAKVTRKFVAFADPPMVAPASVAQGVAPAALPGNAAAGQDVSAEPQGGAMASGVASASVLKPTALAGARSKGGRTAGASKRNESFA